MLGISGSGKTSYMAGLAQRMCNSGVMGITISPTAETSEASAVARSNFSRVQFANNKFQFPAGTMSTTNWNFALARAGKHVCHFDWVDFRGGFIDQLHTGVDTDKKGDIEGFLSYAQASDGILVFVDMIQAYRLRDDQDAFEHFSRLPAIFRFLIDTTSTRRSMTVSPKSLVIVGTKADSDLLPKDLQTENFSGLNELLRRQIFRYAAPLLSSGWKIAVCSVGAVGLGKVTSTEAASDSVLEPPTVVTKITGMPSPINVEVPLLYCLLHELRKIVDLGSSRIAHNEDLAARARGEKGLGDWMISLLTKAPSAAEQLIDYERRIAAERNLLTQFLPAIPEIEEILRPKLVALSI
jgi:hypothetical protein